MWWSREQCLTIIFVSLSILSVTSVRRKKMLVRRKVLVNNSIQNRNITREERDKPVRILKRRIITDEATPVLSSPLSSEVTTISSLPQNKPFTLPQNKPFTVNETVAAKPDAVKRCKIFFSLKCCRHSIFSFISLHNCFLEARSLYFNYRNKWHLLLIQ